MSWVESGPSALLQSRPTLSGEQSLVPETPEELGKDLAQGNPGCSLLQPLDRVHLHMLESRMILIYIIFQV